MNYFSKEPFPHPFSQVAAKPERPGSGRQGLSGSDQEQEQREWRQQMEQIELQKKKLKEDLEKKRKEMEGEVLAERLLREWREQKKEEETKKNYTELVSFTILPSSMFGGSANDPRCVLFTPSGLTKNTLTCSMNWKTWGWTWRFKYATIMRNGLRKMPSLWGIGRTTGSVNP